MLSYNALITFIQDCTSLKEVHDRVTSGPRSIPQDVIEKDMFWRSQIARFHGERIVRARQDITTHEGWYQYALDIIETQSKPEKEITYGIIVSGYHGTLLSDVKRMPYQEDDGVNMECDYDGKENFIAYMNFPGHVCGFHRSVTMVENNATSLVLDGKELELDTRPRIYFYNDFVATMKTFFEDLVSLVWKHITNKQTVTLYNIHDDFSGYRAHEEITLTRDGFVDFLKNAYIVSESSIVRWMYFSADLKPGNGRRESDNLCFDFQIHGAITKEDDALIH